jgi:glycine/sarcosine N-methyltransferase
MTKTNSDKVITEFYDLLSSEYDEMTGFPDRFNKERSFFTSLIQRDNIQTVLDAGCGTGFHSLLLAQLGVDVTGVDISAEMLRELKSHARAMNQKIKTKNCKFSDIRKELDTTFDAVICMGNSLAHLLSIGELQRSVRNFFEILNPGGILVVQILNYERILKQKQRIVNIKESGDKMFVRFYDFLPRNIIFNILTIDKRVSMHTHRLQSVELCPIREREIRTILRSVGFTSLQVFGNIQRDPFVSSSSSDLITITKKR